MENLIKNLKISNFKSIREAELECGRINLFVGKPNVGKSNVLEALSLLGASYSKSERFMSEFIRYEEVSNWFPFEDTSKEITVESEIGAGNVFFNAEKEMFELRLGAPNADKQNMDLWLFKSNGSIIIQEANGKPTSIYEDNRLPFRCPVKKYAFKPIEEIGSNGRHYLNPPFGDNLFHIMQIHKQLRDELPDLFEEYKLEFIFDRQKKRFEMLKREGIYGYKVPYRLIADTLQRIIFHYAAIFSNKDSVILFEEPESHSFPPYINELAQKIMDSQDNQFFITTHSPYLFFKIVESTPSDELAVFVTHLDDYETKFNKLTDEELSDLMSYGTDIFFNLKWFVHE